jgi:hypothetical protein
VHPRILLSLASFINASSSWVYVVSSDRMISELEKKWREEVVAYFEVL